MIGRGEGAIRVDRPWLRTTTGSVKMISTMRALMAHVRGGRLLLDEVLTSGGDYLDSEDRERLHASIERGLEDVRAGRPTSSQTSPTRR